MLSYLKCQCFQCQVEDIWMELFDGKQFFTVVSCYHHLKRNIAHYTEALEKTLDLVPTSQRCLVGGDININMLKVDDHYTLNDFVNLMFCKHFISTITLSTTLRDSRLLSLIIFSRLPKSPKFI